MKISIKADLPDGESAFVCLDVDDYLLKASTLSPTQFLKLQLDEGSDALLAFIAPTLNAWKNRQ